MREGIARLTRKLESIGHLDRSERLTLEELPLKIKYLGRHEDAARDGDHPTASCLLLDGFMHRYKVVADGGRQIVALHTPGDIPDLQSLHLRIMDHNLAATVASTVAFIDHDDLRRAIRQSPRLGELMWRDTLIDGAIFRTWLTLMGRQPAIRHLAHLICELFLRLQAVGLTEGNCCRLPLRQQTVADALGLSMVHTNRSLMALRGADIIELEDLQLTILDWDGLVAVAQFDPTYLHFKDPSYEGMQPNT